MSREVRKSVLKGGSLPKSDPVFEVLGDLDELMAVLALARVYSRKKGRQKKITEIEADLRLAGAAVSGFGRKGQMAALAVKIRGRIDGMRKPKRPGFVQPEEAETAWLNLARAVCRRLERKAVGWKGENLALIEYLNGLSQYLFRLQF